MSDASSEGGAATGTSASDLRDRLRDAMITRDFARVDEVIIELVGDEGHANELDAIVREVGDRLAKIGEGKRAAGILILAAAEARPRGRARDAIGWLKKAVRFAPDDKSLRGELAETFKAAFGERDGLDDLLEETGLTGKTRLPEALEKIEDAVYFAEGDFCLHRGGWGVGKVVRVNFTDRSYEIDFQKKPGHGIGMEMARKALDKLPADHVEVLSWVEPDRLRDIAKNDPVELLRIAIRSLGGKAALKDVKSRLAGPVLPAKDWTKWWTKARKAAANDPLLDIEGAPRTVLVLRAEPRDPDAEVEVAFDKAYTVPQKARIARDYLRVKTGTTNVGKRRGARGSSAAARVEPGELPSEPPPVLPVMLLKLADKMGAAPEDLLEGGGIPRKIEKRAARLEGFLLIREAARLFPAEDGPVAQVAARFPLERELPEPEVLVERLRLIPDTGARLEALRAVEESSGDDFLDHALVLMRSDHLWDIFEATAERMIERGHADDVRQFFHELNVAPTRFPDAYAGFARTSLQRRLGEVMPEGADHVSVAIKALTVLDFFGREFQMSSDAERKAELKESMEHLRATLLEKKGAHLSKLADEGAPEDLDRAFTLIRRSCGLTENQKHTLERPLIKQDGEIVKRNERATITTADVEPDVILTTPAGLRKRQDELRHLLDVEIPENSRDIGRAAAMGDLSENAEWSAAIERQGFLTKKAAELEESLKKIEVIDHTDVDTSCVAFGTTVTLRNTENEERARHSILGPWDTVSDTSVISYLAPMARALTGARVGEVVEVMLPDGKRRFEVLEIERAPLPE